MDEKQNRSILEGQGLPAQIVSPGKAVGILHLVDVETGGPVSAKIPETEIATEIKRFDRMTSAVAKELESAAATLQKDGYIDESEIVKTHIHILKDSHFREKVIQQIRFSRRSASAAIEHALQEFTRAFERSTSAYLSERSADLKDLAGRLIRKLHWRENNIFSKVLESGEDAIVVISELLPSYLLQVQNSDVVGFIVAKGTALSHAAIFAKSFGLPVLKLENLQAAGLKNGMKALLDAEKGRLFINPAQVHTEKSAQVLEGADTVEHLPLKVRLNIVASEPVNAEILEKTDGIGLYRTEYLFMSRSDDFPTEDDQYRIYSELFEKCKDVTMTARTLDIGADKELSYFSLGPQENPYLGFRAHRVYRFHPEIFITQVKALLRAAVNLKDFNLLYPMIETTDDLSFVQNLLGKAIDALHTEKKDYLHNFKQGVLIEVPSAVWNFRELLEQVDVASVGTNDLLQYTFAIDRNNANAYSAYRPEHPVVWRMIKSMIDTAHDLKKPLTICGEIAADPYFIPLLIGLELDAISINAQAIDTIRGRVLSIDPEACRQLASQILSSRYAREAGVLLSQFSNGGIQREGDRVDRDDAEFIDPVCNMVVHTKDNEFRVDLKGRNYFFCCKRCMEKFVQEHLSSL